MRRLPGTATIVAELDAEIEAQGERLDRLVELRAAVKPSRLARRVLLRRDS